MRPRTRAIKCPAPLSCWFVGQSLARGLTSRASPGGETKAPTEQQRKRQPNDKDNQHEKEPATVRALRITSRSQTVVAPGPHPFTTPWRPAYRCSLSPPTLAVFSKRYKTSFRNKSSQTLFSHLISPRFVFSFVPICYFSAPIFDF